MARIRYIKPEFFTDEKIGRLRPMARLFFIGLWCCADRVGKLEDKPMELGIKIIPYDLHKIKPQVLLKELETEGFIKKHNGVVYIINFGKHQRPHPDEKKSDLPDMPSREISRPAVKFNGQPLKRACQHTIKGTGTGTDITTAVPAVDSLPDLSKTTTALMSHKESVNFSLYRLNVGKYKHAYVKNVPVDECRFLLAHTPRLGAKERAALQWRIAQKESERTTEVKS